MKSTFSIGEVSKIYGLSVQALRHYHKIGLVVPSHIDESTGYRSYTFEQFQFISRLKYLQSLGLSLEEIKKILNDGNADRFKEILRRMKEEKEAELRCLQRKIQEIDWTISYYSYIDQNDFNGVIYKRQLETRHIITSGSIPGAPIEDMDVDLHSLINSEPYQRLTYRRQYGYLMDFSSLLLGTFNPLSATLFITEPPAHPSCHIRALPGGSYLCYCAPILSKEWDAGPLLDYLNQHTHRKPAFVIAVEYEDNLREYYNALYEIQIYFSP